MLQLVQRGPRTGPDPTLGGAMAASAGPRLHARTRAAWRTMGAASTAHIGSLAPTPGHRFHAKRGASSGRERPGVLRCLPSRRPLGR
jgi:hypothetical protein